MGPVRAELTIEIARTPEDVFSYLTDVSNLPAWQGGVKSATLRDGRIEESRSLLGKELTRRSRSSSRRSRACSRCARSTARCRSPSGTSSSRPTAGRG